MTGADTAAWDALQPSEAGASGAVRLHHELVGLDVVAELARQRTALAAADRHGLGLLLAAESSGALVAAEMTWAGLPWRADVHAQVLTEQLGPRPTGGARPVVLERLLGEVREALDAPGLNPDSPPPLLAALHGAGLEVEDTRSWTLEQTGPPRRPGPAGVQEARPPAGGQRLVVAGRLGPGRTVPPGVPGRRGRDRPLVLPRRGRADGPGPTAHGRRGRRRLALLVADAAQLEPRVLAGMSGDAAMVGAGRGRDLYQGMVDSGAVATRGEAKLGIIGAMYGGTRGESGRMVTRLAARVPGGVRPGRGGRPGR